MYSQYDAKPRHKNYSIQIISDTFEVVPETAKHPCDSFLNSKPMNPEGTTKILKNEKFLEEKKAALWKIKELQKTASDLNIKADRITRCLDHGSTDEEFILKMQLKLDRLNQKQHRKSYSCADSCVLQ